MKYCASYIVMVMLLPWHPAVGQYIRNGAMDAAEATDNVRPYFWGICDEDSDPTMMYSYSPADGSGSISSPDNSMFCLIRARSMTLASSHHDPGTVEHLFTELIAPLEKNHCYRLTAYLVTNENGRTNDIVEPNVTYPLRFQVWGGTDSCSLDEMLIDSDPIDNLSWQRYAFTFSVQNNDYPYIYIRPYWDTVSVKPYRYNGIILMDDLKLQLISDVDTFPDETVYFSLDPPLVLTAPSGITHVWTPEGNLSVNDICCTTLLTYTEQVTVKILDDYDCPSYKHFNVIYDCDSVYKNTVRNHYDIYYKYNTPIYLVASPGRYYEWDPKINLSGYEDRSAELTGYQNNYTVSVEDYFGCTFHEQFSIIAHCDTLYPEKSFHRVDTLVSQGEEIILKPSSGSISVPWTPAGGLSCSECDQPVATPASTTLYTAQLSDEFNCMHEELFYIEIELEIPNAITPNEDGFNDRFVIGGLPPGSSLSVYRSDGLLVYSEKNYGDNGWWRGIDENGKSVESGTYWYLLEIPAINETKKGFLFIKR